MRSRKATIEEVKQLHLPKEVYWGYPVEPDAEDVDPNHVETCIMCGVSMPCPPLDAVTWLEYESSRADRFLRLHMEWALKAHDFQTQRDTLMGIVSSFIEPADLPLWKRISNQRLALRVEQRTRAFYERLSSKHYAEIRELHKKIEENQK